MNTPNLDAFSPRHRAVQFAPDDRFYAMFGDREVTFLGWAVVPVGQVVPVVWESSLGGAVLLPDHPRAAEFRLARKSV